MRYFLFFLFLAHKDFTAENRKLFRDFFKSFFVQNLNVCPCCRQLANLVRKLFCVIGFDKNPASNCIKIGYIVNDRIAFADIFFKDCKSRIIGRYFKRDTLGLDGYFAHSNTACRRLRIRSDKSARSQFYSAEVSCHDNCRLDKTLLANDVENGLPRRARRLSVVAETSDVAKLVRNVRITVVRCVRVFLRIDLTNSSAPSPSTSPLTLAIKTERLISVFISYSPSTYLYDFTLR